jgi:poly-beta-1,6-N-acetyl-D-glucosamine synthase
MPAIPTYVLISPARNEAQFIELTIQSVVNQRVRPLKWVIVSDGSTDGMDEIVAKYLPENPWIELVRMPERRERNFAGKVIAFNAGYERLGSLQYDAIGSLDADISFDEDYFSFLLQKMAEDPSLGLVGTPFKEGANPTYDYRYVSIEHVSGACQLFRRECFADIGGYTPIKGGGIDYVAVVTARMKGWKTRTYTEKVCFHHRGIGTAQNGALSAKFKMGAKDYNLGNHPAWELFRTFYQMTKKPFVIGGVTLGLGYLRAAIKRNPRPVSPELVKFVQQEQLQRLKKKFMKDSLPPVSSKTPAQPSDTRNLV